MAGYVVRAPVKWGSPDGSIVWLQPGEELPGNVPEEDRLRLLAGGSVVPAEVHKAVEEQDEKRRKLDEQRAELDAQQAALQTEEITVQAEADRKLAEVQSGADTGPERGVVTPKPQPTDAQKQAAEQKAAEAQKAAKEEAQKKSAQFK